MEKELIIRLNKELAFPLADVIDIEALKEQLAAYINQLILKDLHGLVSLLYRIDISEAKITFLLNRNKDQDAGQLIAEAIIEREIEKVKSRRDFRRENIIPEEEKW